MLAHTVRSGLIESFHHGSAVAVDTRGNVLAEVGEPDRPIFFRSAIKPLQALVSVRAGTPLAPEELAVTCASHSGFPIHVAIVRSILAKAGLGPGALQTPPDWPLGDPARAAAWASGHREPRRIWHNCSGKHAGWLATCRHKGWDLASYLDPDHPLQQNVIDIVADATGHDPRPVGVDGCGAPTLRGSIRGLATAFARMSVEDQYAATVQAVHRFPGLVGGNDRGDGKLGAWWDGLIKAGAQGVIVGARHGVGIAVRSAEGSAKVAVVGMIAVARHLGLLSAPAVAALEDVAAPPVLGGGRRVGAVQPVIAI